MAGFTVTVDGRTVAPSAWRRRDAVALVKILALAPRARLRRDRVIDLLWPDLDIETALSRLHKAAHFARQAMQTPGGIVLRDQMVSLFPDGNLVVDVADFERAAAQALKAEPGSVEAVSAAIDRYQGDLLPDDLAQAWSDEPRSHSRLQYVRLLRNAGRWEELLEIEPTDEKAHVELLRRAVAAGDRTAALRRFDELERVLDVELGVTPGAEAILLRDRIAATRMRAPTVGEVVADRPVPGPTLLERRDELDALSRTLKSVRHSGRGALVTVTGEAGSGKSSLVRAFLESVGDGIVTAIGGCDDLLAPVSLSPFRDMVQALPDLAPLLAADPRPSDVFTTLLRYLAAAPTLVILEDVHWADDVTLDAIRYLSRRLGGLPSVLLLTFRDEEVDLAHPLRRILGGLNSSMLRRIELKPLSVAAVGQLAGVASIDAREIHRVTRGNPFFVTEILDAPDGEVPATVRDAVLARVGRLPAVVRRFVQRLAVVPSRAERWLAEALTDGDPDVVLEAERSGVINGGAEHVTFRHELSRRAVETSLMVGEVVLANRVVLDALLAHPDVDPSRIVHHAVRAARMEVVLHYGPVAATAAEHAGAHRQAAETLRVVLQFADRLDAPTKASLLIRRAYSLYVVNEYEAALKTAQAGVAVAESTQDPVLISTALVVLSRIALFARGPMTARLAAGRAVAALESSGPAVDESRLAVALTELARTHSDLVTVGIVAQPSADALEHARRAVAMCERIGRDELRAQALCYLGSARLALGDPRWFGDVERALSMGAGVVEPETRVRSHVNAAGCAYRCGRMDEAQRLVATGLQLAADTEFAAGEYRLCLTSAAVLCSRGDWDRAVAILRRLVGSRGSPGVMAIFAQSMLARLLARRGDPECVPLLAEAMGNPIVQDDSYVCGPLAAAALEVGWLTGTLATVPPLVTTTLSAAARACHTAMQGELSVYLRRAGFEPDPVPDAAGPWAPALRGDGSAAADAWSVLGESYEQAVELAGAGAQSGGRERGLRMLAGLGAVATVAVMTPSR